MSDITLGIIDDYAELMQLFGYSAMFSAAFPLAPLLAFVSNYVEIRVDAWKICQLSRRPEVRKAADIGSWEAILEILVTISILTNAGICTFTNEALINVTWAMRAWTFVMLATGVSSLRIFIQWLIPDTPTDVIIQNQRQDYFISKLIENLEDRNDDFTKDINFKSPTYLIGETDDDPL